MSNHAIGYGYGVYWKHGIYRAAVSETIVVDYRDLQITGEVGVLIKGSAGDDVITPSTRCPGNPMQTTEGDIIYGGGGDDYIRGSRGHDILFGEQGADVLIGGRKGDTLIGGPGDDRLRGGLGKDVFRFEERSGDDVIGRFRVGTDLIALDHHLFKSAADALSHFDQTKKGAVLSLGHDTVLFKGTTVEQFSDHDLLFV